MKFTIGLIAALFSMNAHAGSDSTKYYYKNYGGKVCQVSLMESAQNIVLHYIGNADCSGEVTVYERSGDRWVGPFTGAQCGGFLGLIPDGESYIHYNYSCDSADGVGCNKKICHTSTVGIFTRTPPTSR